MTRVFISYSHDSDAHKARILGLADELRAGGLDVHLDQYIASPSEGWPQWTQKQLVSADFVLLVCTPIYCRRFEGEEDSGVGHGTRWEALMVGRLLYEAGSRSEKLLPVLFPEGIEQDIPLALRSFTYYRIPDGYDDLYRRLTKQPKSPSPPIGESRSTTSASQLPPPITGAIPPSLLNSSKGQMVENVVVAIESFHLMEQRGAKVVRGALFAHDDDPTRQTEVDVVVEVPAGQRIFRVGIDVRVEPDPLPVPTVEQLLRKASKLKQSLDRYCVVSTSGFEKHAIVDAKKEGVETIHLRGLGPVSDLDGWKLASFQHQFSPNYIWWIGELDDSEASAQLKEIVAEFRLDELEIEKFEGVRVPLLEELREGGQMFLRDNRQASPPPSFMLQLDPKRAGWVRVHFRGYVSLPPRELVCKYQTRIAVFDRELMKFASVLGIDAGAATWVEGETEVQTTVVQEKIGEGHWKMIIRTAPVARSQKDDPTVR